MLQFLFFSTFLEFSIFQVNLVITVYFPFMTFCHQYAGNRNKFSNLQKALKELNYVVENYKKISDTLLRAEFTPKIAFSKSTNTTSNSKWIFSEDSIFFEFLRT